jgi:hypothetical protein
LYGRNTALVFIQLLVLADPGVVGIPRGGVGDGVNGLPEGVETGTAPTRVPFWSAKL